MHILEVSNSLVFSIYNPEKLNHDINQSFKNQEQVEAEAKWLEKKLLENYEFKKAWFLKGNGGNLSTQAN